MNVERTRATRSEAKRLGLGCLGAVLLLLAAGCGRIIEDSPRTPTPVTTANAGPATELRPLPPETPVRPPVSTATADPATQPTLTKYLCEEGRTFEAWVFPRPSERAVVVINGQTNELGQQPAASGISYANQTMTFRAQGQSAFLEEGGQLTYRNCRAQ